MKKLLFALLLIPFLWHTQPAAAHVLSHDVEIGIIMHVVPDDDPVAGRPVIFQLEFKDVKGKFQPQECLCSLQILKDDKLISTLDLHAGTTIKGLNIDTPQYIFKDKGHYTVRIIGNPKSEENFEEFTLDFPLTVARQAVSFQDVLPHSPAQLRRNTNIAHWGVGYVILATMILALLHIRGLVSRRVMRIISPASYLVAGWFVVLFTLLHDGWSKLPLNLRVVRADNQSWHHVVMGILLIAAGTVEWLRNTKRFSKYKWLSFAAPFSVLGIGLLFLGHPQYGTKAAVAHSLIFHRFLGSVLILGGLSKITQIFLKRSSVKPRLRLQLLYAWLILMLAVSLLLVTYHEPPGAYEGYNPDLYGFRSVRMESVS